MPSSRIAALATTAWLRGARGAHRRSGGDIATRRHELVRRLAPGRTFVDVGGMWNIHGEIAFAAAEAGASRVVLFDAMEPTEEFERRAGGSAVEFVRGDLHDRDAIERLGRFDVVWCTGVVYHTPHPLLQVENLRRLSSGTLLLGSQVIPEVPGLEGACVLYPALSERGRNAYRAAHGGDGAPRCVGVTEPFDPALGYANYWWGISPSALRAMAEGAGFRIAEEIRYSAFLLDLLAELDG